MFDWFWEFLYLLTKSIFRLIDGLVSCTDYLCGIKEVKINDEETDLMSWLLRQEKILNGVKITMLVAFVLVIFFTIWKIIKVVIDEKPEGTPAQILIKAAKSILTFLFVPTIMITLVWACNAIGTVMYAATKGGSTNSMGAFLVGCFAQDALESGISPNFYAEVGFDYTDTDQMWFYFDLSDFDYFYSWVAGVAILFAMFKVLMIFVDRMFSIVILYIIAPIPIAASIVDEGQHFKQWRDQILSKFLVGYGAIMGLNIYALVTGQLATADIEFFDNAFIDWLFKLIIILGGAMALNRLIGLIGNLVAQGAGDAELQAGAGMWKGVKGIGKAAASLATKGAKGIAGLVGKMGSGGSGGGSSGGGGSEGGGESNGSESQESESSNKNPAMGTQGASQLGTSSQAVQGGAVAANPYVAAGAIAMNAIQDKQDDKKQEENKNSSQSPVGQAMNNNKGGTITK